MECNCVCVCVCVCMGKSVFVQVRAQQLQHHRGCCRECLCRRSAVDRDQSHGAACCLRHHPCLSITRGSWPRWAQGAAAAVLCMWASPSRPGSLPRQQSAVLAGLSGSCRWICACGCLHPVTGWHVYLSSGIARAFWRPGLVITVNFKNTIIYWISCY
jgi:hypothetical protein